MSRRALTAYLPGTPAHWQADKLGDWEGFNEWLRAEYDAEDLAEFTFEDEDDLDIYLHFKAKCGR